jgi:hypothetical protein
MDITEAQIRATRAIVKADLRVIIREVNRNGLASLSAELVQETCRKALAEIEGFEATVRHLRAELGEP